MLADELEVRFPHIGADEGDIRNDLLAHCAEEPLEGLDGPLLTDPEQASDAEIDLINESQVLVALGVLDFIHADRVNLAQFPVFQTPRDDMFDCVENLIPRSVKGVDGFFPRKATRPAGQEEHVRFGQ